MSDSDFFQRAEEKIAAHLSEIAKIKSAVNHYCLVMDLPLKYEADELHAAVAPAQAGATARLSQGPDEFFNKPLASAVRTILERSRQAGRGPMSVDQIHPVLVQGGFNFSTGEVEGQKNGVRISLAKNSVTFSKLPNDLFGLAEWYGPKARKPRRSSENGGGEAVDGDEAAPAAASAGPNEGEP